MSIIALLVAFLLAAPTSVFADDGPLLKLPQGEQDYTKTAPLSPIELGGSCDDLDPARRPGLLIKNARVIDGTGKPAQERVSILVQDGKIAMVGQGLSMRSDRSTAVMDASGLTVLPGLIDLRADFSSPSGTSVASAGGGAPQDPSTERLRAYLAAGVTTVVDTHSTPEQVLEIRRALGSGSPGPRYLTPSAEKPGASADVVASTVRVKLSTSDATKAGEVELPSKGAASPVEAIHGATQVPADILGLGDLVGTIAVGKRADLLIVRGDPSKDLGALRDVAWTVREGVARTPEQWMQAGGFTAGAAAPSAPNAAKPGVAP